VFGLFTKKKKEIVLTDLDGNLLKDGDLVLSLRYDLGECKLVKVENGFEYQSLITDERVSWLKMIDAVTERQKVLLKQ
jgi:hypothetical protein